MRVYVNCLTFTNTQFSVFFTETVVKKIDTKNPRNAFPENTQNPDPSFYVGIQIFREKKTL